MSDSISFSDLGGIRIALDRWRAHVRRLKRENFHATEEIPEARDPDPPRTRPANGYNSIAITPNSVMQATE